MARLILGILLLLATQEIPTPYEREPYPEGFFCSPKGVITADGGVVDASHPCHCARMDYSEDCEGPPQHPSVTCTQFCHTNKCQCPTTCHPGGLAAPDAAAPNAVQE